MLAEFEHLTSVLRVWRDVPTKDYFMPLPLLPLLLLLLFAASCDHSPVQHTQPSQQTSGREVTCTSCGSTFLQYGGGSSSTTDNCPNCPLDMCEEGMQLAANAAIAGNLAELRPQDVGAAKKFEKALNDIVSHCERCSRCKNTLRMP